MTERIATPIRTRAIMERYGFNFKKGFGQNFLIDTNVLDNIADAAGITSEDTVLEIGPGFGSLTQTVAERAKKVISLEIDTKLIPILNETLADYNNIEIINKDVLKCDIDELSIEKNDGKPFKVVANLPYYITTPIIMDMLEKHSAVTSMTVMVQKEVAERMSAKPSTKDYGAITVLCQYYTEPSIVANVPASLFVPPPKVDSAVLKLKVLDKPSVEVKDEGVFFRVVKAAFSQRRKTLLNCLSANFPIPKDEISTLLESIGIAPSRRGETLSLKEFANIADTLLQKIK